MRVSVLDPTKNIYEGNAREVILPGEDGEFAVLDFHQPFLHRLTKGYVFIKEEQSLHSPILIKRGIARMLGEELTIMVET